MIPGGRLQDLFGARLISTLAGILVGSGLIIASISPSVTGMVIGHLSKIASIQTGRDIGFLLVAATAIFNSAGRPMAGMISDRLGRSKTMMFLYLCQGAVLLAFPLFRSFGTILFGAGVVTFAYGAMLSVYPSAVCDFYGTKNLGLNYGILFTAWGVGGIVGPILAGTIVDSTGGYFWAYIAAGSFCFVAAAMGWMIKPMPECL